MRKLLWLAWLIVSGLLPAYAQNVENQIVASKFGNSSLTAQCSGRV
jgi:hypothetical protein